MNWTCIEMVALFLLRQNCQWTPELTGILRPEDDLMNRVSSQVAHRVPSKLPPLPMSGTLRRTTEDFKEYLCGISELSRILMSQGHPNYQALVSWKMDECAQLRILFFAKNNRVCQTQRSGCCSNSPYNSRSCLAQAVDPAVLTRFCEIFVLWWFSFLWSVSQLYTPSGPAKRRCRPEDHGLKWVNWSNIGKQHGGLMLRMIRLMLMSMLSLTPDMFQAITRSVFWAFVVPKIWRIGPTTWIFKLSSGISGVFTTVLLRNCRR